MTYLITYDLISPGQNYSELYEAIKAASNGWWHCLESNWIIKSDKTARQILDFLIAYIDENDKLLVINVSGDWVTFGLSKKCNDWLQENI